VWNEGIRGLEAFVNETTGTARATRTTRDETEKVSIATRRN
jgi:hypothetical protein